MWYLCCPCDVHAVFRPTVKIALMMHYAGTGVTEIYEISSVPEPREGKMCSIKQL